MILKIWLAWFGGSFVALFTGTIASVFLETEREKMAKSLSYGSICALTTICAMFAPAWINMLCLPIVLAAMLYLDYWWAKNGSSIGELLLFVASEILMMSAGDGAAFRIHDLSSSGTIIGITMAAPVVVFVLSLGYYIADMIWFYAKMRDT